MAYQLSPGVLVQEKDISGIVPAVSSSKGAYSGAFSWGPVMSPVIISNENNLVEIFGKPGNKTAVSFWTAANFLAYSNFLYVNRLVSTDISDPALNAVSEGDPIVIRNGDHFTASYEDTPPSPTVGQFVGKYPGEMGNGIEIHIADSATFGDWEYKGVFSYVPGTTNHVDDMGGSNDEIHVVIVDSSGNITGTRNTILERYEGLSKATGAIRFDGSSNYYKDVLNHRSRWIWVVALPKIDDNGAPVDANWGESGNTVFDSLDDEIDVTLTGGKDGKALEANEIIAGWLEYLNTDTYDINLLPLGDVAPSTAAQIVANLVMKRLDCMAFISPGRSDVVDSLNKAGSVKLWRETLEVNTSYAVLDSGWKYQYDRYTGKYLWVPLNGDVAGLCAYTDFLRDPWYSPAGFNRGFIRNVVKLAYSPSQPERDELYPMGINPVVTLPGEGTLLLGDRTSQLKPSAFDRINVRRLFIALGKAISTAAKYQLFEFNDEFTRANFRAMVEPYLEDVRGRRGIIEFMVRCDATNNTSQVIDANEFVAEIYVQPSRSVNFIKLTLVATRSGVSFEEVIGQ